MSHGSPGMLLLTLLLLTGWALALGVPPVDRCCCEPRRRLPRFDSGTVGPLLSCAGHAAASMAAG